MTEFSLKVIANVRRIPRGKIATYSQIAALSGKPHAPRAVAWILNSSSNAYKLPWHRVLNSKGKISFKIGTRYHSLQRRLLEREKVEFSEIGEIDLGRFQWKKSVRRKRGSKKTPSLFRE